jgi:hypothetical protein
VTKEEVNDMRIKYPRTYHLPWSLGKTADDKVIKDLSSFYGKMVVVTEKMDGENTSIYSDGFHARSIDSKSHESRSWLAGFQAGIGIPDGWRICGENLYAKHSIKYENLNSYFYGFSIWNEYNICLSWTDTEDYFSILGIDIVPVIWKGMFNEHKIMDLCHSLDTSKTEGLIVRLEDSFCYTEFSKSVAKYVRANHVSSDMHWIQQKLEKNSVSRYAA